MYKFNVYKLGREIFCDENIEYKTLFEPLELLDVYGLNVYKLERESFSSKYIDENITQIEEHIEYIRLFDPLEMLDVYSWDTDNLENKLSHLDPKDIVVFRGKIWVLDFGFLYKLLNTLIPNSGPHCSTC